MLDRNADTLGFTPRTKRVIENAFIEASKIRIVIIYGTEHLLIGILREGDSVASKNYYGSKC
ncbi:MAG: hypothetical protein ACLTXR_01790 [Clostridia bacterium]